MWSPRRRTAVLVLLGSVLLASSSWCPRALATNEAVANAVDDQASLPPWLRHTAADDVAEDAIGDVTAKNQTAGDESTAVSSNKDAKVALTNIVLHPDARQGQKRQIGVKNLGSSLSVDLTGWKLVANQDDASAFVFGETGGDKCKYVKNVIPAKGTVEYKTKGASQVLPCTLSFDIKRGDDLQLFDSEGELKASLKLDFRGTGEYKLSPEGGDYWLVPYAKDRTLMETLDRMGHFKHFTKMLRHFQFDRALAGLGRKRWQSCGAVAYYPYYACTTEYDQEYEIYYRNAPFTVLAPTDEAVEKMLKELGGGYAPALTVEEYMGLDEGNMAKDMLKYHVIKGHELTTGYRQPNSTLPFVHLPTNRNNSEIVAFGNKEFQSLCVHEDCVEAHTQDEYGCKMQVEWDKCGEDWMNDAGLFSKRELGYCEISCGKCKKSPETCTDVPVTDIKAKNGVLHVLDRVLEVPDVFEEYVPPPPEPEPEPEPASILNRFPTFGDLGLTDEQDNTEETIEDLIELYLSSRRARRTRQAEERRGGVVLDGLGR
ncbi:FAS1 domain-containing protein [Chloropicon primus]|nr:FAS1 domain-containing protein [Chloropicon primus]